MKGLARAVGQVHAGWLMVTVLATNSVVVRGQEEEHTMVCPSVCGAQP